MACDVRSFFSTSLHRWMVAIVGVSFILSSELPAIDQEISPLRPQQFAKELLIEVDSESGKNLVQKFDQFEDALSNSTDPLSQGRQFLLSFLNEIKRTYNVNLTIHDACLIVKQNLPTLQVCEETKKAILYTIEIFESDTNQELETSNLLKKSVISEALRMKISWPWDWNWFGLNKKDKKNNNSSLSHFALPTPASVELSLPDEELPGNIYAGGAEILAGALLLIISEVFPPAAVPAWGLIGDGSRRVLDGVVEISEERRKNGTGSSGPLSVEF